MSDVRNTFFFISLVLSAGCAHTPVPYSKCSALAYHSATEVDICLPANSSQVGARLTFTKERCPPVARGAIKKCYREKLGEGTVLKVLDEHLSTVKLDSEFQIDDRTTITSGKAD